MSVGDGIAIAGGSLAGAILLGYLIMALFIWRVK